MAGSPSANNHAGVEHNEAAAQPVDDVEQVLDDKEAHALLRPALDGGERRLDLAVGKARHQFVEQDEAGR